MANASTVDSTEALVSTRGEVSSIDLVLWLWFRCSDPPREFVGREMGVLVRDDSGCGCDLSRVSWPPSVDKIPDLSWNCVLPSSVIQRCLLALPFLITGRSESSKLVSTLTGTLGCVAAGGPALNQCDSGCFFSRACVGAHVVDYDVVVFWDFWRTGIPIISQPCRILGQDLCGAVVLLRLLRWDTWRVISG